MTAWIKKGSRVLVSAIKARKPEKYEVLHLDRYISASCVVVDVWEYPPEDPKFEVLILHPPAGVTRKIVVRASQIGGQDASS